jgi:hypothetical protein
MRPPAQRRPTKRKHELAKGVMLDEIRLRGFQLCRREQAVAIGLQKQNHETLR